MRSRTLTRLALLLFGLCLFLPVRAGEVDYSRLIREGLTNEDVRFPYGTEYRILYGSTDPRAEAAIRAGLNDTSPLVRLASLQLLLDRRVADAAALTETGLHDRAPNVRRGVLIKLWNSADPAAFPTITALLHDEDATVCAAAARALRAYGAVAEAPLLAALREESTKDTLLLTEIIKALAGCGGPATVTALEELAPRVRADKREEVVATLFALGEPAADALARLTADPEIRRDTFEKLASLPDPRAQAILESAAQDPDPYVRATALPRVTYDADTALPRIYAALRDADAVVRKAALSRLEDTTLDERAVDPLLALLDDPDVNIRASAAERLRYFRLPRVTEALYNRLRQGKYADEILIAETEQRDPRTLPYYIERITRPEYRDDDGTVYNLEDERLAEMMQRARGTHAYTLWLEADVATVIPLLTGKAYSALREIGEPAVAPLVQAANSSDPRRRRWALEALESFDDPRALETLLAVVKDRDKKTRMTVLRALGKYGDARAYPALIAALKKEKDEQMRAVAAEALLGCQDPRIIDPLARLLRSRNVYVREAAFHTLAAMDDPHVRPLLAKVQLDSADMDDDPALHDPAWLHRPEALEALHNFLFKEGIMCHHGPQPLLELPTEMLTPVMERLLRTPNQDRREGIASLLGERREAEFARILVGLLTDENVKVRYTASSALEEWCAPEELPRLRALLAQQDDPLARHAAIRILAHMGDAGGQALQTVDVASISDRLTQLIALRAKHDPQALPLLLEALHDPYYEMRKTAVRELGLLGDPRATPALLAALQDRRLVYTTTAVNALAGTKDPVAVESLIAGLQDARTREYCAMALCGVDDARAADALLAVLPTDLARTNSSFYSVVDALISRRDPRVADRLVALLQHWQRYVPTRSLYAGYSDVWEPFENCLVWLGKLRDPRVIDACAWVLREHPGAAAVNVLADMGGDRALGLLLDVVDTTVSPEAEARKEVAKALGRITAEHLQEKLTAAAQSPRWRVRHAVVLALAQRAEPWAAALLTAAQNDPQPQVARAARQALADTRGNIVQ